MTTAQYYGDLASADINADVEALRFLATDTTAPQVVQFYAAHKAVAVKARLEGKIEKAVFHEGLCEGFYKRIQKRYRW